MEEKMVRRILWPKRFEVPKNYIELDNEKFHGFQYVKNIITVTKWRNMTREVHAEHVGGTREIYKLLLEKSWREQTSRNT